MTAAYEIDGTRLFSYICQHQAVAQATTGVRSPVALRAPPPPPPPRGGAGRDSKSELTYVHSSTSRGE
jgi:hypothetical protein